MPRARFIHPEAPVDADFARHSRCTRLFFFYVLTIADDAGNFPDDARELKAKIYPYDDDIGLSDIAEFLKSLTEDSTYIRYVFGKYSLLHIRNFKKYQRPDYPSAPKYPLFPGQTHTFYAKEKGKNVKRTVHEKEWNRDQYGEDTVSTLSQGRVGKGSKTLPPTPTPEPTAPADPGPPPSSTGSPGPPATTPRKATRLDFEIPRHADAMQTASRLGLNLAGIDTLEKLEEEIALVKAGGESSHLWVKKQPQTEKTA